MKFEFVHIPDRGQFDLFVEGKWFDTFDSVADAVAVIGNLLTLAANPIVEDFVLALCRADVARAKEPEEP